MSRSDSNAAERAPTAAPSPTAPRGRRRSRSARAVANERRTVHCAEALDWLAGNPLGDDSAIVTSLPDTSELRRLSFAQWRDWFGAAAAAVLRATPARSAAIFYQSDVRHAGRWVDKAYLVQRAAESVGSHLLWHRIVCRAPAGTATGDRPGYAHLLCFSRQLVPGGRDGVPDVLPQMGAMTWSRATGVDACDAAVCWLRDVAGARVVVDPFCGHGTVLAAANRRGLFAVGVERSSSRAAKARALAL